MSHAWGEIIVDGKSAGFYEYDGTVDIPLPDIRATLDEVGKHWRNPEWTQCTCGQPSTPAQIFTDYGGGAWWWGTVCLTCKCITGPFQLEDVEEFPGHPLKSIPSSETFPLTGSCQTVPSRSDS